MGWRQLRDGPRREFSTVHNFLNDPTYFSGDEANNGECNSSNEGDAAVSKHFVYTGGSLGHLNGHKVDREAAIMTDEASMRYY